MKKDNLRKLKRLISRKEKVGINKIILKEDIFQSLPKRDSKTTIGTRKNLSNNPNYEIKPVSIDKKPKIKRNNPRTRKQKKKNWISKLRNLRRTLRTNKQRVSNYRKIYREIKGNCFKNKKNLLKRIANEKDKD